VFDEDKGIRTVLLNPFPTEFPLKLQDCGVVWEGREMNDALTATARILGLFHVKR
jgi:hypothetical protein